VQKSYAIIGTYNHLPEGLDESAFEETYQVCWRPFLSALYRFPDIMSVLYYSGTLLRKLESRHPEFLMLLEEMTARKQIELLGGGFFAPLFPILAGTDRLGQIELLTTYIRKSFGKRPRGCWLQDYAWDSGLPSTLQTCGFDYTFLSERQCGRAGASMDGPAFTEDQGKSISVFPVFDAMESFPDLLPPLEALASLGKRIGELQLATLLYPDRAARILWKKSGLESPDVFFERSFASLQKESLILETTTPSRYLKMSRSSGRAYFSSSGSELLMRRSLPPNGDTSQLVGGDDSRHIPNAESGNPRRLLLRYDESLYLYAKMQYVRILVSQLRGDKSRKKTAQEDLWKAQCGDAYWYSPSGGIARLPIRAAAYSALIEAEKTTRQRGGFAPGIIRADIDFDGEKEILYQGLDLNAYVHLRGGTLLEFDSLRSRRNYVNAHPQGVEQSNRDHTNSFHRCFHDRFFELGSFSVPVDDGFSNALYTLADSERPVYQAVLIRESFVELGGKKRAIGIRKAYSFRKGAISIDYEIFNRDIDTLSFRFTTELNLALAFYPTEIIFSGLRGHEAVAIDSHIISEGDFFTGLRMENHRDGERIELRSDRSFALSHTPLFSSLLSEEAEATLELYQGCRLQVGWDLNLASTESTMFSITLELGKL